MINKEQGFNDYVFVVFKYVSGKQYRYSYVYRKVYCKLFNKLFVIGILYIYELFIYVYCFSFVMICFILVF